MATRTTSTFLLSVILLIMFPINLSAEPACCGQAESKSKGGDEPDLTEETTVVCYAYATGDYGPMVMPGSATGPVSECDDLAEEANALGRGTYRKEFSIPDPV